MDSIVREALLVALTDSMRKHSSWCGETHLQKSTYFLQEMAKVPTGFEFILYRHGPFSFDLRTQLTAMRADDLLTLEPSRYYGPRYRPTELGSTLLGLCEDAVRHHRPFVEFIASWLGPQNVADLERLGTAYYVLQTESDETEAEQARKVHDLKPHIKVESAVEALQDVKLKLKASKRLQSASA
jgi:hypothetical protein